MDTQMIVAVTTGVGTLIVSLLGSYVGSRFASRTRWTDRMSDALPKFYAAATVAWYAWQRYTIATESAQGGPSGPAATHYYDEHISTYRDLLATSATLVLLLPKDRRQSVWDLLDLWEGSSDPHSEEHENRWMTRVHDVVNSTLELVGRTAPVFPGR